MTHVTIVHVASISMSVLAIIVTIVSYIRSGRALDEVKRLPPSPDR